MDCFPSTCKSPGSLYPLPTSCSHPLPFSCRSFHTFSHFFPSSHPSPHHGRNEGMEIRRPRSQSQLSGKKKRRYGDPGAKIHTHCLFHASFTHVRLVCHVHAHTHILRPHPPVHASRKQGWMSTPSALGHPGIFGILSVTVKMLMYSASFCLL